MTDTKFTTKTTKDDDGEYCVRLLKDGEHVADADYFTDDRDDAKDTAAAMVRDASTKHSLTAREDARRRCHEFGMFFAMVEESIASMREPAVEALLEVLEAIEIKTVEIECIDDASEED